MSARAQLGGWSCPSGNHIAVFLEPDRGDGVRHATLEWDSAPPLSDLDTLYYLIVILPAVTKRAQEYLERPGPAVAVIL